MMDIYNFIDSNDIREHCRRIGHIFTPLEKVYLINRSRRCTAKERHSAMLQIIDEAEDFVMPNRAEWRKSEYEEFTFHEYVKALIENDNLLYQRFCAKEESAVYVFLTSPECLENCRVFSNFDKCFKYACDMCEGGFSKNVVIAKKYMDNFSSIFLSFNEKKELSNVWSNGIEYDEKTESILTYGMSMWFNIPTPFKKGDVLCDRTGRIFILDSLCTDNSKRAEYLSENGDLTDMEAVCFVPDKYENLHLERFFPYIDLDYCTDEEEVRRYKKLYDLEIKSMDG